MQSKLKNFLILFSHLRMETNNSPANLTWLANQKAHLTRLCYDLDSCYREILRFRSKKNTKHTIAPAVFYSRWEDYEANWEAIVVEAAGPEKVRVKKEFLTLIDKTAVKVGKTREELCEEICDDLKEKRPLGATFDPLVDDPAAVLRDLEWWIHNCVENEQLEDIFDDKTIGAWIFFKDIIGIDHSVIFARWRSAPELFIPEHALNRNITPIVDLYNEAVRAYIFGLTIASVAMCRALLEHVLKKHYHINGNDLENIIFLAEERHDHLKSLNLQEKRRFGNKVLHKYKNRTESIEKAAVDFLLTLRHVVTHIPT